MHRADVLLHRSIKPQVVQWSAVSYGSFANIGKTEFVFLKRIYDLLAATLNIGIVLCNSVPSVQKLLFQLDIGIVRNDKYTDFIKAYRTARLRFKVLCRHLSNIINKFNEIVYHGLRVFRPPVKLSA